MAARYKFIWDDIERFRNVTSGGSYSMKFKIGNGSNGQIGICKESYAALYGIGLTKLNELIKEVKDGVVEHMRPLSDFTAPCNEEQLTSAARIGKSCHVLFKTYGLYF
jgi:hypothetical protein